MKPLTAPDEPEEGKMTRDKLQTHVSISAHAYGYELILRLEQIKYHVLLVQAGHSAMIFAHLISSQLQQQFDLYISRW